jgi:GT2 family glycosyltransferase
MPSQPSAAILVLNYNGRHHLEHCLPSLSQLTYPRQSVTVVDNGSTDDSLTFVKRRHPDVTTLALGANRGFAPAYNVAVRESEADIVVLLNNDTRVEPAWLDQLVDVLDRHQAAAAASCMLDWDGCHIDFAGVLPTFIGHGWQVDHGRPVGRVYTEHPLLFGCGGSLAIRRSSFLEVGGFDDDFFVYFEDLDLGWRMSLAGHDTILAPRAITYHRLHGTAKGWGHTLRLRLYERNALYAVFKNYGDEALSRILPAAIALTLGRALAEAKLDDHSIGFGRSSPDRMQLPPPVVATLLALEDFARALPQLQKKREQVQASRRRPDEELFALFPEPLRLHEAGDRYRDAAETLIRDLGIDALFGFRRPFRGATSALPAPQSEPATPSIVVRQDKSPSLVSVVVLTASGAKHLPECLDSLRRHDWPADRTEVVVVDNGSAEDPTATARRHYPGVRVVRTGRNLGFSGGNNAGARVARGDWLAFLNDDTRVSPGWITEMMAVAERRRAASVGAFIVDWDGERVDFAGGLMNFEGRGYSLGHGLAIADGDRSERPLLFGCGAAVMFRRDVFEATGGWDEPTFAYYEDVEFGWRLWMLGHEVWFAPRAMVYHRHHGTSGKESPARARAFERNALRMVYSLLEDETLRRVLPAALLLAADRLLLDTPFSRAAEDVTTHRGFPSPRMRIQPRAIKIRLLHALSQRGARRQYPTWTNLKRVGIAGLAGALFDTATDLRMGWEGSGAREAYLIEGTGPTAAIDGREETLSSVTIAKLLGLGDFLAMLPDLSERRAWLQEHRHRSDAEIVGRFGGHWTSAVPSSRLDLHLDLRNALLGVLRVEP